MGHWASSSIKNAQFTERLEPLPENNLNAAIRQVQPLNIWKQA